MFYVLDVAGVRNYLLVPGLPIGLQRSGKNYPTSPLMYLLVRSRLRDSLLVLVNNFQLNSGPAPDLENRRRGPQVAVTVTGNECLTRGPHPPPAMLPDGRQRRGHWGTPVPAEIPNLGTCRVIVHLIGMLTRRPLIRGGQIPK